MRVKNFYRNRMNRNIFEFAIKSGGLLQAVLVLFQSEPIKGVFMETSLLNHLSHKEHSAVVFAWQESAIHLFPVLPICLQTLRWLDLRTDRNSGPWLQQLFWEYFFSFLKVIRCCCAPNKKKVSRGSPLLLTSVLRVSAGALCKEYSFPSEGLVSRVTQSISAASCLPSPVAASFLEVADISPAYQFPFKRAAICRKGAHIGSLAVLCAPLH